MNNDNVKVNLDRCERIRAWTFKKSINGTRIWPMQYCWVFTQYTLVTSGRNGLAAEFEKFYLTDEEYILEKLSK